MPAYEPAVTLSACRTLHALRAKGGGTGIASLCIGGGMGIAMVVQA